jgi:hypothetical protein
MTKRRAPQRPAPVLLYAEGSYIYIAIGSTVYIVQGQRTQYYCERRNWEASKAAYRQAHPLPGRALSLAPTPMPTPATGRRAGGGRRRCGGVGEGRPSPPFGPPLRFGAIGNIVQRQRRFGYA